MVNLSQNTRENPIHIINVSIKSADTEDDEALVKVFAAFTQSKVSKIIVFILFLFFFVNLIIFLFYMIFFFFYRKPSFLSMASGESRFWLHRR